VVDVREEGVIGPATPPQVPRQHRSCERRKRAVDPGRYPGAEVRRARTSAGRRQVVPRRPSPCRQGRFLSSGDVYASLRSS